MKKLSYLALAATLALGSAAVAVPAMAAPSTNVLSCPTGNSQDLVRDAERDLAAKLKLQTMSTPTIDQWNGCLKVQYTDTTGHTNVALYDPDTLKLVNQLS